MNKTTKKAIHCKTNGKDIDKAVDTRAFLTDILRKETIITEGLVSTGRELQAIHMKTFLMRCENDGKNYKE